MCEIGLYELLIRYLTDWIHSNAILPDTRSCCKRWRLAAVRCRTEGRRLGRIAAVAPAEQAFAEIESSANEHYFAFFATIGR